MAKRSALQRATIAVVKFSGYLAGLALVALMIATVADVAGRYMFNAPITGVFDLTHIAVVVIVYLGLAYCTYYGAHAAIEVLVDRFDARIAAALARLIHLSGAAILLVIAWRSGMAALQVQSFGQTSQLLLVPLYPFYWVVVFGCALTALVLILQAIDPGFTEKDELQ